MGGEDGKRIIQDVVTEIQNMPELKHINFTKYASPPAPPSEEGAPNAAPANEPAPAAMS